MVPVFNAEADAKTSGATRWVQLLLGIICMVMIANLQYSWTFFVNPIDQKYHWGRVAIQVAFTIFVLTETWLVPLEGYLIDKIGPRAMVFASGVLAAISWGLNSVADALIILYVAAAIGGIAAGTVYFASIGNALKWFPDRRGLAVGLTAAGFGALSMFTVEPIANMIASSGYEQTFLWFGIWLGVVVGIAGLFLRAPRADEMLLPAAPAIQQTNRDFTPGEALKTPTFWVMYAMFVMVGTGVLMALEQLSALVRDFKIGAVPTTILFWTLPALQFAVRLDRVLDGLSRPFFGWISDQIGRENTMFIAFLAEGIGICALLSFAMDPLLFVMLSGVIFFTWGEIYSLFPATCTDLYGRKYATTNYGMLYTAKGVASLLAPFAIQLYDASGNNRSAVFIIAALLNIVAALMAVIVLKPLRRRIITQDARFD
jgi:MFS transporter, OFA family, oxalate/formate antiporter